MKKSPRDSIEFPANPFVALADFVIVVLMILILAFVHQSIASDRLFERMAVEEQQQRLLASCTRANVCDGQQPGPKDGGVTQTFEQSYWDGDLQRFWFNGYQFPEAHTEVASPQAQQKLRLFGELLASHQPHDATGTNQSGTRGRSTFKRVVVEGYAAASEGDDVRTRQLSLARAMNAAELLIQGGLRPENVQVTGCGSPRLNSSDDTAPAVAKLDGRMNRGSMRRVDVVVEYSGRQAATGTSP